MKNGRTRFYAVGDAFNMTNFPDGVGQGVHFAYEMPLVCFEYGGRGVLNFPEFTHLPFVRLP